MTPKQKIYNLMKWSHFILAIETWSNFEVLEARCHQTIYVELTNIYDKEIHWKDTFTKKPTERFADRQKSERYVSIVSWSFFFKI